GAPRPPPPAGHHRPRHRQQQDGHARPWSGPRVRAGRPRAGEEVMAAADDADDEARAHEVVLARDAARVRAYRDGRYGDGLSGAPDVTPEDAARGVLDRLRADPAWAGAVPTEEEAVAGLT